jgi:hypothetical protein
MPVIATQPSTHACQPEEEFVVYHYLWYTKT